MDKAEREKLRKEAERVLSGEYYSTLEPWKLALAALDHIDALELRIEQLTGRPFSDRMYAAMESSVIEKQEHIDALERQVEAMCKAGSSVLVYAKMRGDFPVKMMGNKLWKESMQDAFVELEAAIASAQEK